MQNDEAAQPVDCTDSLEDDSLTIEVPTRKEADVITCPASPFTESRSTLAPLSPKSAPTYAPCAHTHKLIQARLFNGGSIGPFSPPQRRGQSDPESYERLIAYSSPRKKEEPPLHPDYTFRPQISAKSMSIDKGRYGESEVARWQTLSSQSTESQTERSRKINELVASREKAEQEICTFRPTINSKSHQIVSENSGTLKRWNHESKKHCPNDNDCGAGDSRMDNKNEMRTRTARPRKQPGNSTKPLDSLVRNSGSPAFGDPVFNDLHQMLRSLQL